MAKRQCGGEAVAFRGVPEPQARDRAAGFGSCRIPLAKQRVVPATAEGVDRRRSPQSIESLPELGSPFGRGD